MTRVERGAYVLVALGLAELAASVLLALGVTVAVAVTSDVTPTLEAVAWGLSITLSRISILAALEYLAAGPAELDVAWLAAVVVAYAIVGAGAIGLKGWSAWS